MSLGQDYHKDIPLSTCAHPRHFQRLLLELADARFHHPDLCQVCRHNPGSQDGCGEWSCLPEGFMFQEDPQRVGLVRELKRIELIANDAVLLTQQPVEFIDRRARVMAQELPNLMRRVADLEKALNIHREAPKTRLGSPKPEI